MRRILIVGEAPNRRGQKTALEACLAFRALGWTVPRARDPFLELYCSAIRDPRVKDFLRASVNSQINLLPKWPGPDGRGSAFPPGAAREAAVALKIKLAEGAVRAPGDGVVLLFGRRVATAWGLSQDWPWFKPHREVGYHSIVVPHPSGISTYWNSVENQREVLEFLERIPTCSLG